MKNKILFLISCILLFLYIFSFIKPKDNRKQIISSLLNSKNVDSIFWIELTKNEKSINLIKKEDVWFVNDIPADYQKIKLFIENLSSVRKMYKLSDKENDYYSYGLTENEAFSVKYYFDQDKNEEILFGKEDFSGTSKYIKTKQFPVIYEIDNSFSNYLNTSSSSWYEPYIISQNITGKIESKDIQSTKIINKDKITDKDNKSENWTDNISKLLELRHGGEIQFENRNLDSDIFIELGNKSQIELKIFTTNMESEFNLETIYTKSSGKSYSAKEKISLWTYSKIKEIML